MASVPSIIHDHSYFLTPGNLGTLCSRTLVSAEVLKRPEAYPEYWMGTLLRYVSQEYFNRDLWGFGNEIFAFISSLPNGLTFIAAYQHHGVLWSLNDGRWPSFNVFSTKDRLRILRRAVRLLWEERWETWLFSIDSEKQIQIIEDSQWAERQGIPPNQTAYERQRSTELRWVLRHPYQAAKQIAEASQRQYRYWCRMTKGMTT